MALTKEQLAARKIGGSDVATILGLNPYKSAVELYHEKRGTIEVDDLSENLPVEAGNVLEDGIAELAAKHMTRYWNKPVKLRRCNLTLSHPKYDWLTIHIDRDVVGEERGVELKNVGYHAARNWGAAFTDEIPDYYVPQPMTYMLIKGYPVWTVAGYFGGADLRLYELARDKEWDEIIIQRTHDFWFKHVLEGVPPPVDLDGPRALDIVKRIYKGTDGTIVEAGPDLEHWRLVCEDAAKKAKLYQETADNAKAHLLAQLGEGAILTFPSGVKLERKIVERKEYTVAATSYVDARFRKGKE
jgi:putative phage-type endonuclease